MLILIIEDDQGLINLITDTLEQNDYEVISATNSEDALKRIFDDHPDIIILDYMLVGTTGEEFINSARNQKIQLPPFIVSTGFGDEKVAVKMMKLGAADYLVKDVNFMDLLPEVVSRTAQTITKEKEHKQLQSEIRQIEQLHKTVIESLEESIHLIDTEFKIQLINSSCKLWCQSTGLNYDVVGLNLQDAFLYLSNRTIYAYKEIFLTGESKYNIEKYEINGKTYYVETSCVPVKNNQEITGIITIAKDITEKMLAEEERRKNEKLLHKIAENFPNSYMSIINSELTVVFSSGKEFKNQGLDSNSYLGLKIEQIYKDKTPIIKEYYLKTFAGEECSFELYFNNQYQHFNTVPIYNEKGKIEQILSVAENITNTKLAQIEMEKNKALLEITQKISKTGGWQYDVNSEKMTWTHETYQIHGMDPKKMILGESSELIDNSILCYHKSDRQKVHSAFEECVKKGISYNFELPFTKVTGENIWIKTNAFAVWDDGKITKVIGNIQDITDIKSVKKQLKKSETEFHMIAQNVPGIVFQYYTDPKGKNKFLYMSPQVENLYGIKARQVINNPQALLGKIHNDDVLLFNSAMSYSAKNRTQVSLELRIIAKNGVTKWTSLRAIPIITKEDSIIWTGLAIDVTNLKTVEKELKYRNRLDKTLFDISNQILFNDKHSYKDILATLGKTVNVNRVYLFQFFENGKKMSNTYEWCRNSSETQMNNLQNLSAEIFPWWMKKMHNHENIILSNINELPDGAKIEKESLESQNIKSLLVVPLILNSGKLFGFIGFDDTEIHRQWLQTEIEVLTLVADLIVNDYERKEASNQLQKNADLFSKLLKAVPAIVIQSNLDGTIIYANDFTLEFTNLKLEEILGKKFFDFIAPYDVQRAIKNNKQMFGGFQKSRIYDFIFPSGHKFTGKVSGDILRDETGQPYGFIHACHDITEQIKHEQVLLQSKRSYEDIFNSVSEAIYILDENNTFIDVNRGASEMYQRPKEELVGLTPGDVSADGYNDLGQIQKSIQSVRETGKESMFEFWATKKNGQVFPKEVIVNTGRYFDKDVLIATAREISERKKMEQELAKNEEQFRTLVENIPGITYRCLNDKDYTMIFLSEEIKKISGYHYRDFINNKIRSYSSIIHPEDQDHVDIRIKKGIESHTTYTIEYRIICKDGSEKWVFEKGQGIFDGDNNLLYLDGVIIDISERKYAEQERKKLKERLQRAQKLETIGTLAGGIAHDFNNILTPIMGYADMALFKLPQFSPLHDDINHILTASKRAKTLVQQILLFSKKLELERNPVQIKPIIIEAVNLIRATLPSTIKIELNLDDGCGNIMADTSQIHQVIVNLCTNSFHAMEDGGKLIINLSQFKASAKTIRKNPNLNKQTYINLTITDNGTGMDNETKSRIFEPFFTTKEVDRGTGMGLSVVHGIIQQHGGDIQVESKLGVGTTFKIYLPVTNETSSKVSEPEFKNKIGNERIILCDDELPITVMAGRMLENMGYQVDTFNSSKQAMEEIISQKNKYKLLISDLTMPELTGIDLAEKIRETGINIPILIMTGYGDTISAEMMEKYNIQEVISKPITMNELATIVRSVLDN